MNLIEFNNNSTKSELPKNGDFDLVENDYQKSEPSRNFHQRFLLITIIWTILLLLPTISGSPAHILTNNNEEHEQSDNEIVSESQLQIIHRHEWLAAPPSENLTDLQLPATTAIIAHTASTKCETKDECALRVRAIQEYQMESRHWYDIGYNFLIGGDGAVYEGRGWSKEGAHTKGFNKQSICIAFIGTFNTIEPSPKMLNTTIMLLNEGVIEKKLHPEYKLYGHRQLTATLSPGDALFKIITKWDHFSNDTQPF